jgi:hypothetical protein
MSTQPSLLSIEQTIVTDIAQQETSLGSEGVGASLNNPGGLLYSPWESVYGATQSTTGVVDPNTGKTSYFASFASLPQGFGALAQAVKNYVSGGATLTSLINAWSPAKAGNTNNAQRIAQLQTDTGLDPTVAIASQASTGIPTSPIFGGDPNQAAVIVSQLPASTPNNVPDFGKAIGFWERLLTGWTVERVVALVLGLICLIMGLSMLKQTQVIVQPVIDAAKSAMPLAAA